MYPFFFNFSNILSIVLSLPAFIF
uniref:Chloroplastic group IIA intron splicing facilitator CRS1ic isoform X1 n=1 Tax=Rhizophora mucronata TaxID=61149 RepID=A0A2P2KKM0_RHIMU